MFRRLLALTCALAVVGALSWGANAAPISGSFSLDFVFHPQGPEINKVDLIDVKFEADLILTFSISGLDITSTTIFTFLGVEFQSFVISATVGALTIKDTIIFSPTFFEFEETRDQYGSLRWCLMQFEGAPFGSVSLPQFPAANPAVCTLYSAVATPRINGTISDPVFGTVAFWEIFRNRIHPIAQNLILARWIQPTNALNNIIRFRKKIADLSLNIAGLVLNVKALFANVSLTATGYTLRSGLVLAAEGKTVSGVGVRGELWLGAKQGLECFGECKPLERFFNQALTGGGVNNYEEEKIFLTNLVIAGVRHDFRAEFHFDLRQCTIDQVDDDNDGWFWPYDPDAVENKDVTSPLCFMQLVQTYVLAPWRLNVQATWNWNGNFDLISNITRLELKAGDISIVAFLVWRNNGQWSFGQPALSQVISSFDPAGLKVTSDITFCTDPVYCSPLWGGGPLIPPVVEHRLSLTGAVGPVSIATLVIFDGGLLGTFKELDVEIGFAFEPVAVTFSAVILADIVGGIGVSLSTKF
ncbi:MAG: hypothetical protein NZ930_02390 [Candidatus Bipolaricaulota bacterium]|nr:hypothetical protein [Candidatus Bipolaricaulota bacterium]MDW8030863.1 hypothetical protein [Candidatus Bipolaricaulota bacterium]